jgi:hypothetical protein
MSVASRRWLLLASLLSACDPSVVTAPPPDASTGLRSCVPGERWGPLPAAPGQQRIEADFAWSGSEAFLWAGVGAAPPSPVLDNGDLYDDSSDVWSTLPADGAPPALGENSTASWAAERFFIWGYHANGMVGSTFDPGTGAWAAITANDAPTPRVYPLSVSTGDRVIVWGGMFGSNLDTGATYDPEQDRWSPMTAVGAPLGRYWAGTIWTGSRMIVWGGLAAASGYGAASGGVYDEAADQWTPTSMINAPAGQIRPAIVWTGSRMIVWGNVAPPTPGPSLGGSYDPETDTWEPLSTDGAPKASPVGGTAGPGAATWTGSRMILFFQGESSTGGAAYDPANDTWSPVPTDVLPAGFVPRFAAWDGCRVLLWGETSSGTLGFTYQPE